MFRIALASAAASVALMAAPATAQSYAGPYFTSSKTQAILGGESRLAAILAQQSGQPIPQAAAISPAGYGAPLLRAAMPIHRPAISMDRPDVFNSVALPIGRTSLDRHWRKVAKAPAGGISATFSAGLAERGPIEQLEAVNRYVNARVKFIDDIRQYGVDDHWNTAADTLRRGRGDCEDYAIAKLQLLRRAGFAEKDLYLVILHDALRRTDHAVLVARAEDRLLVLDNGTDRLVDSYEMPDYRPIVTFSGNRAWTHGYRRETPPMVIASNQIPAGRTAAPAPSAQAN
jgi:predicted transglutaminase-like cysteine proteinase